MLLISSDNDANMYVRIISRYVHCAAVTVRAVRVHHRVVVHGPQVPDRPGDHAARVARHRDARHPSAHCCCTGKASTHIHERPPLIN